MVFGEILVVPTVFGSHGSQGFLGRPQAGPEKFPRFGVPRVFWTGRRPVQKILGVFASIFYGFVTILEGKMVKNHTKS